MKNWLKDLKKGFGKINQIGKNFSRFGCFVCVLTLSLALSFQSFADTYDHLLSGDVGEFITPADDDSNVRNARSSIASIENTVNWVTDITTFRISIVSESTGKTSYVWKYPTSASSSSVRIQYSAPQGYYISQLMLLNVYGGKYIHCPDPGTYNMQIDFTSQFSYEYDRIAIGALRQYENANKVEDYQVMGVNQSAGDVYLPSTNITITSGLDRFYTYLRYDEPESVKNLDYTIKQRFEVASVEEGENYTTAPNGMSSADNETNYKDNVSSSLSDVNSNLGNISSSMQEQAANIGKVETAVNNLRGAMEPHYEEVLTQLHHITEQLHAFWDQLYNMFYLPQYARLGEILTAIQNLDVNITVDVDGLKSAVSKVSTDIQAKQESVKNSINSSLTAVQNGVTGKLQTVEDNLESTMDENTDQIDTAIEEHGNFIIDGLKSLFIPSDEFFKNYFDDLLDWFTERFGFLSYPLALVGDLLLVFMEPPSADQLGVIVLPAIEICGYELMAEYRFSFVELFMNNEVFYNIMFFTRTFSSIGLVFAFFALCNDKFSEVMRS